MTMHPNYDILPNAAKGLVVLRLSGSWDEAITAAFAADLTTAVTQMIHAGSRPDHLVALVDMRRKNILPQHIAAALGDVERIGSAMKRIAMMVSSTLHKFQARRIVTPEAMEFFEDEQAALAWLLCPHALARPPVAATAAAI